MADDFDSGVIEELPKEVSDKLAADFGEFHAIKTRLGWVAMRGANKPEYDRYFAMLVKENERAAAQTFISQTCVIFANGVFADPADTRGGQVQARAALTAMINKKPGIISNCAACALDATGVDGDATAKKYGAS